MEPIDLAKGSDASWLGFALNVVMLSSQLPLMLRLARDPEPERYSFIPALGQWATTFCWSLYAFTVLPTPQVKAINLYGCCLAIIYAAFFVVYLPGVRRKAVVVLAYLSFASLASLYFGLLFGTGYSNAKTAVSTFTTLVNVSLWATPLTALRVALRELDTRRVSVPLSFAQLAAASTWTSAGFYLGDVTLVACSMVGVVLSVVQLAILGVIFWKRREGGHAAGGTAAESGGESGSGTVAESGKAGSGDGTAAQAGVVVVVVDAKVGGGESSSRALTPAEAA